MSNKATMDFDPWLDILWNAIRKGGHRGYICQGFCEQNYLAGKGPEESAKEYLLEVKDGNYINIRA